MEIEKNGCIYKVVEKEKVWELTAETGKVSVVYRISKADCPAFDSLKDFFCKDGE